MTTTTTANTFPATSTAEIDTLLEHYLSLLDTYTTLRAELNALQSSIHLSISRANFSSPRGIRYGQDFYDDRMQARQRLSLRPSETETPSTSFVSASWHETEAEENENEDGDGDGDGPELKIGKEEGKRPETEKEKKQKQKKDSYNPLRMFGILTPAPLRDAQTSALEMLGLVPRIANVDAEMREVEIRIRRARKGLLKTERKLEKESREGVSVQG